MDRQAMAAVGGLAMAAGLATGVSVGRFKPSSYEEKDKAIIADDVRILKLVEAKKGEMTEEQLKDFESAVDFTTNRRPSQMPMYLRNRMRKIIGESATT